MTKPSVEVIKTESIETYQSGAKRIKGLGRQSNLIDNILSSGSYKDKRKQNHSKGTLSNNIYEDTSSQNYKSDF